ncbi:hypothetical protein HN709_03265, partial [Candidatus Peregrinibacteria bacterium]|nr:hypothetical protein [Candidatus Peregrinibacteria bacterium]
VYIYGFNFNNFSEDELVKESYYFLPVGIASIVGIKFAHSAKSLLYFVLTGVGTLVALFVFYEMIWPEL